MKKTLLLIISILLLSGCTQKDIADILSDTFPTDETSVTEDSNVTKDSNTYSDNEFNVSFSYPSNWEVQDKRVVNKWVDNKLVSAEVKLEHYVVLITGDNEKIYFNYQSESFAEYESKYIEPREKGGLSIEETTLANYPAKQYIPYGIDASEIHYIIKKNEKFVMFSTEHWLTEEQKVGLGVILNSLEL